MPVFGDGTITPAEKKDMIAYITQTRSETNPGGFSLGRNGPVTEGLLAWVGWPRLPRVHRHVAHRQAAGPRQG